MGGGGGGAGGGGGDVVDKRCIAVRDARSLVTKRTEGGIKFIGQKRYVTLERPLMNLTNQHKLFVENPRFVKHVYSRQDSKSRGRLQCVANETTWGNK